MLDARGRLLIAALGFAGLSMPSYDRALWALRMWLDSWPGVAEVTRIFSAMPGLQLVFLALAFVTWLAGANLVTSFGWTIYLSPTAGSHRISLMVNLSTAGTLTLSTGVPVRIELVEERC